MKDERSNYIVHRQRPPQFLTGPSDSRGFNRHPSHVKNQEHVLVKELTVSENAAHESARETGESPGSTNGCDEVAHPVKVHRLYWNGSTPHRTAARAEELKHACLVPECVSCFHTQFYERTQQPHLTWTLSCFILSSLDKSNKLRMVFLFYYSSCRRAFWGTGAMAVSITSSLWGGKCRSIMSSKWRKAWRSPFSGNRRSLPELIFFLDAPLGSAQAAEIDWPVGSGSHFLDLPCSEEHQTVQNDYKTRFCWCKHICVRACVRVRVCVLYINLNYVSIPSCRSTVLLKSQGQNNSNKNKIEKC